MQAEVAKTLVYQYFDRLLNQKDISVCDEMLAVDYIDHDAPPETPPGPESTKTFVTGFLANHPDLQITIHDMIAEGNKVAARIVWQGTNSKSGEKLHRMGIVFLRLNESGQLAERWSGYQPLS